MIKRIFVLLLLSFFLLGCATRYHSGKYLATGYTTQDAPGRLKKIIFTANEFTPLEKVEVFTLFRCAQLGKQLDKPYFALYSSLTDAALNRKSVHPSFRHILLEYQSYAYVLYKTTPEPGDLSVSDVYDRYELAVIGKSE